jgi:ribosomal protein L30/L7E
LRRIRDSKIIEASPENLGMIETVKHMVNVEQIKE